MAATWQESKGVKIVTKNFGVADSHKLGGLPAARRLRGAAPRR